MMPMMPVMKVPGVMLLAIGLLSLAACAGQPPREEPHHYSKNRDGERVACFQTEVANEYECLPVEGRYARRADYYAYDPLWPFFSVGLIYGLHHHGYVTYYPYYPYPHPRYGRHRRGHR